MVFVEENGGVEGQESGRLDFLADVAMNQKEFEEQECGENEFEEAPQAMEEEGEKAPHGNQGPGETLPLSEDASYTVQH